jgi:hypothetical protein
VCANGIALPTDAPSVAAYLHEQAGYRTASLGKALVEPAFDMKGRWFENRMAREGSTGPFRGFERMELAMHGAMAGWHYSLWLRQNHPDEKNGFYTTDHGELQGDFGLLHKGPYHVDALMHIPMIWRPAPSVKGRPAQVSEPVGQLDLAPTFCKVAGRPVPDWMQGAPLPTAPGSGRERVITVMGMTL